MPDDVWPVGSAKTPTLVTYKGIGTVLTQNTRPDADGCFFATNWLVVLLPIAPLARYHARRGRTTTRTAGSDRWTTTEYTLLGRSRVRVWEVLRVYALCWLVAPAAFIGPIVAAPRRSSPHATPEPSASGRAPW
jgi:hypothetical protein